MASSGILKFPENLVCAFGTICLYQKSTTTLRNCFTQASLKMPRGKSRNATTSRDAQRTLSFNSKSAKVTKPSVADATRNGKKLDNLAPTVQKAQDVIKNDAEAISTPQVPTEDQAPLIEAKTRDDIDIKAEKIPEKALLQYWRIEEERRKARRGARSSFPSWNFEMLIVRSPPGRPICAREDTATFRLINPIRPMCRNL